MHPANIGILTSENRIHFDSINFDVGNEVTTSIQNNNNLRNFPYELVLNELNNNNIEQHFE